MNLLKETPGGLPVTKRQRMGAACGMTIVIFALVFGLLCKFGSSNPIVNDYPKLKALSLISPRAAYFAQKAQDETMVPYFMLGAAIFAASVGLQLWLSSDPRKRPLIVERGQKADSDALLRKLKNMKD